MAEQSEKVADIDPRFSSFCVHANENKMRILKLDIFIFFLFVVLEYICYLTNGYDANLWKRNRNEQKIESCFSSAMKEKFQWLTQEINV